MKIEKETYYHKSQKAKDKLNQFKLEIKEKLDKFDETERARDWYKFLAQDIRKDLMKCEKNLMLQMQESKKWEDVLNTENSILMNMI